METQEGIAAPAAEDGAGAALLPPVVHYVVRYHTTRVQNSRSQHETKLVVVFCCQYQHGQGDRRVLPTPEVLEHWGATGPWSCKFGGLRSSPQLFEPEPELSAALCVRLGMQHN